MYYEDSYMQARTYLGRVREAKESIDMLEKRISLRAEIGADVSDLEDELANANDALKVRRADVADMVSRLGKPNVQMVLLLRYVELKTWEQIATEMDRSIRSVQSLHGSGLVQLEAMLAIA